MHQVSDRLLSTRSSLRRNYLALGLDGGLFMGGMAFIAADTVLPTLIRQLGGPNWVIGLLPVLMGLGFMWTPLFVAHRVERMATMKPFILPCGLAQRLPFLIAGIALLLFAGDYPMLALSAVVLAPLISGSFGGASQGAYLQMNKRVLPANRLASSFAMRFIVGAMIAMGAGTVIEYTLSSHPGTAGYAYLH